MKSLIKSLPLRKNKTRYAKVKGKDFDEATHLDIEQMCREILPSGAPRYYFHMGNIEKTGVRVALNEDGEASYHSTPMGVYCYPLTLDFWNSWKAQSLPYLSDAKYTTVIEATEPAKMGVLVGDVVSHKSGFEPGNVVGEHYRLAHDNNDRRLKVSMDKFRAAKAFGSLRSHRETNSREVLNSIALFNKELRQHGYTSIYDPGIGAIHPNEPHQAVFLTPTSYRVVARLGRKSSTSLTYGTNAQRAAIYKVVKSLNTYETDVGSANAQLAKSIADYVSPLSPPEQTEELLNYVSKHGLYLGIDFIWAFLRKHKELPKFIQVEHYLTDLDYARIVRYAADNKRFYLVDDVRELNPTMFEHADFGGKTLDYAVLKLDNNVLTDYSKLILGKPTLAMLYYAAGRSTFFFMDFLNFWATHGWVFVANGKPLNATDAYSLIRQARYDAQIKNDNLDLMMHNRAIKTLATNGIKFVQRKRKLAKSKSAVKRRLVW